MARPSKFTKVRTDAICQALKQGCTRAQAAESVGIHPETLRQWYVKGRKVCEKMEADGADGLSQDEVDAGDFYYAAAFAEATAEVACVKLITDEAETNWRAAAYLLRCRRPEDWNPNRRRRT
ncbi:MAG: transposase [Capsulimonadaceae bacterium]